MYLLACHKSENTEKVKANNNPELGVSDHLICSSGGVFCRGVWPGREELTFVFDCDISGFCFTFQVYKANIGDLATAKWPAAKKEAKK